jgi:PKD repeat protein
MTIPNSVISIGDSAFHNCTSLTSVTIGTNVTSIGDDAFSGCTSLTNVTIPNSVTSIGDSAFYGCSSLTSVTIGTNVTSIGEDAFSGCSSLTSVTIPNSVTNIESYAFFDCTSLTNIYFEGNAPSADSTVFSGDNAIGYYLSGSTGWSAFSTNTDLPTMELTAIAITANPTSGFPLLTVGFTSAAIDSTGHAISNWTWDFGDGATSGVQNPSHTYTTAGTFAAALIETNSSGVPIAGSAATITVSGLILNGGFETGDFTGWTLAADPSYTFVDYGSVSGITPYSGSYEAALGAPGSLGYLSQTLVTIPGTSYLLSFWLDSPDGETPNEFLVSWNGSTLFDQTNLGAIGWTNLQFLVSATGTSTVLEFGFRDDPSYLGLHDISVVAVQPASTANIAGINLSGSNLVINGINGISGVTYYVLTSTNLALPSSQWTPVATNVPNASGNFTITVTNAVNLNVPQCFYILQMP